MCCAMTIAFRSQELTLQRAAKCLEEPDRTTRQEAWELAATRRYQDHERVEEIFDQLLALRERIAKNAALPDYRAYCWKSYKRFDYTPEQCLAFPAAIPTSYLPLVTGLDR